MSIVGGRCLKACRFRGIGGFRYHFTHPPAFFMLSLRGILSLSKDAEAIYTLDNLTSVEIASPAARNDMKLIPFVVSPSAPLRTGLSNHERPFDRLRANGLDPIFVTMTPGKCAF
jgi:hypothetical protein